MSYIEKLDTSRQLSILIQITAVASLEQLGELFEQRAAAINELDGAFVMHKCIYERLRALGYKQSDIDAILTLSFREIKHHMTLIKRLTDEIICRLADFGIKHEYELNHGDNNE